MKEAPSAWIKDSERSMFLQLRTMFKVMCWWHVVTKVCAQFRFSLFIQTLFMIFCIIWSSLLSRAYTSQTSSEIHVDFSINATKIGEIWENNKMKVINVRWADKQLRFPALLSKL